jgi:hypothetical protein
MKTVVRAASLIIWLELRLTLLPMTLMSLSTQESGAPHHLQGPQSEPVIICLPFEGSPPHPSIRIHQRCASCALLN